MKKKTITNIFYVLDRFKYLLIFCLTTIYLIILLLNISIKNQYNTKLAFNTNIINIKYFNKTYTPKQVIKIQIKGFDSISFGKILLIKNHIQKFQNKQLYTIKIAEIIDYLQNNGFLNKVEYFIMNIYENRYFIINININPIIKRIEIKKYNQLKIPTKLLINLFKNQTGMPANYKQINSSLKTIYSWYRNKGFTWIYIKIIKYKNSNIISLKIFEGKIIKNNFICKSKKIINNIFFQKIEKMLAKELEILPGSLLNIKKLEQGIKYLKNIKLIESCKYSVVNHPQGLKLKIEYSILANNYGYFYDKHFMIQPDKKSICSNTRNKKNTYSNKNILNIFQYRILDIKNNIQNISYSQYFGIKYFFSYLNSYYKNLIIDIQLWHKIPQFSFLIFYPNIYLNQNLFSHILLNFHNKINIIKLLYPFYNIKREYSYSSNSLKFKKDIRSRSITISLRHNTNNHIYFNEHIVNTYNLYRKRILNIRNYFIENNTIDSQYRFKISDNRIKQKLFYLKIQIKYNSSNLTNRLQPGQFFFFESLFFKSLKFNKINNRYQSKYSGNNFKVKYKQTFFLPKLLPYFKKNALIVLSEVNWLIGPYKQIIQFQQDNASHTKIYFQENNKKAIKNYLYHIEYHISIYNFFSYYLFYNFSQIPCNIYKSYFYKYNTGLGIQFYIPIKIIPKVRLEYSINPYKKNYYQLRVFSSYTN